MTDPAIIAASYAAERNYSHNPDDVIDASGAVGAWGTAKESTTELVDLSGNGHIADIHGPMPTEGFIQGRRFSNGNYIERASIPSIDYTKPYTVLVLLKCDDVVTNQQFILTNGIHSSNRFALVIKTSNIRGGTFNGSAYINLESSGTIQNGVAYLAHYTISPSTSELYLDSVLQTETGAIIAPSSTGLNIGGKFTSNTFEGIIYTALVTESHTNQLNANKFFNTLARLPFWSVNYIDYPNNVAEYTNNLPYSSSIISSGTFKVDDDKLQCVSAGTMTYSASYEFDGSEYIKVKIGGVEYAGTGTITQGNTTVSVAQGSNKVTIQMGTGDTIEGEIGIQFREEV